MTTAANLAIAKDDQRKAAMKRLEQLYVPQSHQFLYELMIDTSQPIKYRLQAAIILATKAAVPEPDEE